MEYMNSEESELKKEKNLDVSRMELSPIISKKHFSRREGHTHMMDRKEGRTDINSLEIGDDSWSSFHVHNNAGIMLLEEEISHPTNSSCSCYSK